MQLVQVKKEAYVSNILPNLYLGDIETSQDEPLLRSLNITHIINLSNENDYKKWDGIVYEDIPIDDLKTSDISVYFDKCNEMISECRSKGQNILVHCFCGVSRSVSIILNYLISKEGYSLKDAYNYLKQIRTNQYVLPNISFFKQLSKREMAVRNESTLSLSEYMKIRNEYKL
jgi:protein-tyrosine phosphatase